MNRNEAFESLLKDAHAKTHYPQGTWASYKHKFARGVMKAKTSFELLLKHGYTLIREEQWEPPTGTERNYSILYVKDLSFKIKNIMAASDKEAIAEVKEQVPDSTRHADVSFAEPKHILKLVNEIISNQ